jgi:hypothetical protein
MVDSIRVEGLSQFRRSLKALDSNLPKALRVALNDSMGIVVDYGKSRITKKTGKALSSIKAKSTGTTARVSEGGNRAPYAAWLDFGGSVGRKGAVKRRFIRKGRYLYPALQDKRAEIISALENSLAEVAKQAGIDLNG